MKTCILYFRGNGRQFRAFWKLLQSHPDFSSLRLAQMRRIEVT